MKGKREIFGSLWQEASPGLEVRKALFKELTFELRPEGRSGVNGQATLKAKNALSRGKSSLEGSESEQTALEQWETLVELGYGARGSVRNDNNNQGLYSVYYVPGPV